MNQDYTNRKQSLNLKWIKADSGKTYLCPADALERIAGHSENDLNQICVDESSNPQND